MLVHRVIVRVHIAMIAIARGGLRNLFGRISGLPLVQVLPMPVEGRGIGQLARAFIDDASTYPSMLARFYELEATGDRPSERVVGRRYEQRTAQN